MKELFQLLTGTDWRKITTGLIFFLILSLGIYDVGVFIFGGGDATISTVLYQLAQAYPVLSFSLGFVTGHVFWPNRAAPLS